MKSYGVFKGCTRLSLRLNHFCISDVKKKKKKSSKRCYVDLYDCVPKDDQRSSRPRHDFQNSVDQLHQLINNQLQMLEPDSGNMVERLHMKS